jgi:hypothetical protein
MDEFISKQVLKDLGAECIAKRNIRGNLIPPGSIDGFPSVNPQANNEDIHREREQAYMKGYEDASKKYRTEHVCDRLAREYISKVKCCDECFASTFCTINGLRNSRVPQDYCIENVKKYFEDKASLTGVESDVKECELPPVTQQMKDEDIAKAYQIDMALGFSEKHDCRDCKKYEDCPCGKNGHESGTSQGYSTGECKDFEPQKNEE